LDVRMPGIDGREVLRRLRADAATAEVPTVFLTASVSDSDRDQLMGIGAAGQIPKPFDPKELPGQIASMLGWYRGTRAAPSSPRSSAIRLSSEAISARMCPHANPVPAWRGGYADIRGMARSRTLPTVLIAVLAALALPVAAAQAAGQTVPAESLGLQAG